MKMIFTVLDQKSHSLGRKPALLGVLKQLGHAEILGRFRGRPWHIR